MSWPRTRVCTSSTCPDMAAALAVATPDDARRPRSGRFEPACRPVPRCSAGRSAAWSRSNLRAATPADIAALVLIATTPSFVTRGDWPDGIGPRRYWTNSPADSRPTTGARSRISSRCRPGATSAQRRRCVRCVPTCAHGEPDRTALEAGTCHAARIGPARRFAGLRCRPWSSPANMTALRRRRPDANSPRALPKARFVEIPRPDMRRSCRTRSRARRGHCRFSARILPARRVGVGLRTAPRVR